MKELEELCDMRAELLEEREERQARQKMWGFIWLSQLIKKNKLSPDQIESVGSRY